METPDNQGYGLRMVNSTFYLHRKQDGEVLDTSDLHVFLESILSDTTLEGRLAIHFTTSDHLFSYNHHLSWAVTEPMHFPFEVLQTTRLSEI